MRMRGHFLSKPTNAVWADPALIKQYGHRLSSARRQRLNAKPQTQTER